MADDSSSPTSSFGQILKNAEQPKTDQSSPPQEPISTLSAEASAKEDNPAPSSPAEPNSTIPAQSSSDIATSSAQLTPTLQSEEATPSATIAEPSSTTPVQPNETSAPSTPVPTNEPTSSPTDSSSSSQSASPAGGSPTSDQSPRESSLDQKLKEELESRRQKANQVRIAKRQAMLNKLATEVKGKGRYTSTQAQEKFNLPQSTLGDYFQDLVERGVIKKFGKGRGMYYTP